jgi:indole-3-glycerol phosphate synthase
MTATMLDEIVEATRRRVAAMDTPRSTQIARSDNGQRFRAALTSGAPAIIAEIKRASPSRGVIQANADVPQIARAYGDGGAAAISVLTEPEFFLGSIDDLREAAAAVQLPLLRKDFIVTEAQLFESALSGASAVLLIAAVLTDGELRRFREIAEDELGLAALVEVHTEVELERALDARATLIGINNRNLQNFDVSLAVTERLAPLVPKDVTVVAESGIRDGSDIERLHRCGVNAFLIGESLMTAADPAEALRNLRRGASE